MNKPDLSKLNGYDLFDYYVSKNDEYSSVLGTAHVEIGDKIFDMLEKAEKEGKKITLKEDIDNAIDSPLSVTIE